MRRSVVPLLMAAILLAGGTAAASSPDSTHDGAAQQPEPEALLQASLASCQGGETVLVIQDTVEWFAPDDPRGNVVTELIAQQRNWCAIESNELATANLAPFGEIIIPSGQSQAFYDNLFPGGVIDPNLVAWVQAGGVLSANLADHASGAGNGGNWDGDAFVGGLLHVFQSSDDVDIANAAHPVIAATVPCPGGNCGVVVDTAPFSDLDGWGFSTHGFFTNVPSGATVILDDVLDRPVMIEYPFGSGVVLATLSSSEWMYGGRQGQDPGGPRNKKLLANEIAYQDSLVEASNEAPVADAGGPYAVVEGASIVLDGSASFDPDGDPLTFAWSPPTFLDDATLAAPTFSGVDDAVEVLTLTVSDPGGLLDSDVTTVTVANVAPTVTSLTAPLDPSEIGLPVAFTAAFFDPGILDTHTATWDWGDLSGCDTAVDIDCSVDESAGSGTVSGTHVYTEPGVYTVTVTVTDKDGASGSALFGFVVIFDPDGGFVTGGGWIDSPAGAYADDPALTGTGHFGFVSKYKKGASIPTGQTEFQFQVADLNFHSSSYDWLVVAGPNAKYKGTGTINGSGNFGFMVTACDVAVTGHCNGEDDDTFRIKIWDKDDGDTVVYDNKMGAADDSNDGTVIGGGNIKVHK